MDLKILLGISLALNGLLIYKWRKCSWYLTALVYYLYKKYGYSAENPPERYDEIYEEFRNRNNAWNKLFG